MCFFKKVELGHEPIIYPCENQCYCYGIHYLPPSHDPSLPALHFPFQHQYSLNLQQLQGQMATDLSSILQGITHNNARIIGTLEVLLSSDRLSAKARPSSARPSWKSRSGWPNRRGRASPGPAGSRTASSTKFPFFPTSPSFLRFSAKNNTNTSWSSRSPSRRSSTRSAT